MVMMLMVMMMMIVEHMLLKSAAPHHHCPPHHQHYQPHPHYHWCQYSEDYDHMLLRAAPLCHLCAS